MYTSTANSEEKNPVSLLDSAASKVAREFHQFIGDLEALIKSANSEDKHGFDSASRNLHLRARDLKHRFEAMSAQVQSSACSSARSADAFAHARPWYLAGIGACLGLVAGVAFTKRG